MPGIFESLSNLLPLAQEYLGQTFGHCNTCGSGALPLRCCKCGESTCHEHAWFSGGGIVHGAIPQVICSLCSDTIEVEFGPEGSGDWSDAEVADVSAERIAWARTILQVSEGASKKEVKKAYQMVMKKYHPDKNPGDPIAAGAASQINEAYEILKKAGIA